MRRGLRQLSKTVIIARNLEDTEYFKNLSRHIVENLEDWERFHSNSDIKSAKLPGYQDSTMWQKLLVLKCIRPDSLIDQSYEIIHENIGPEFLNPEKLNLKRCYKYSDPAIPLIFILSESAYDPAEMLRKFAGNMNRTLNIIALQ